MMLAAGAFDFLDGFTARLLRVSSPIGAQLDSLSDAVSFGVLPAVMLAKLTRTSLAADYMETGAILLCAIPLLIAVFSAVRLAKFNIDERQHFSFLGLPTPASAILCGALAVYCEMRPVSLLAGIFVNWWAIAILTVAICALLVCEIPFFSFKISKEDPNAAIQGMKRTCFLCICVVVIIITAVLSWHWSAVPLGIVGAYILENLILRIFKI